MQLCWHIKLHEAAFDQLASVVVREREEVFPGHRSCLSRLHVTKHNPRPQKGRRRGVGAPPNSPAPTTIGPAFTDPPHPPDAGTPEQVLSQT